MTSSGQVNLKEIRSMLRECAPDHTWREKKSHFWVGYKGKEFKQLPKGGSKGEIEMGWVRKMVRHLDLEVCAAERWPHFYPKRLQSE